MKDKALCTIISANYISFARILVHSFLQHHPDGKAFVLLADENKGYIDPKQEEFYLIQAVDLAIPSFTAMCFKYDITEFNTALKPFFLEYLFETYKLDRILYLDPDCLIMDTLDTLYELLDQHSILLTPHILSPISEDGYKPDQRTFLMAGSYNLGFIGVANNNETRRFLEWWKECLSKYCVIQLDKGLFVDQKWIDLVPAIFDNTYIIRDDAYNVSYWNLHERKISYRDDTFFVNDKPIVFYHFSGFVENLEQISKHQTRFQFSELPDLYRLFKLYQSKLYEKDYQNSKHWEYSYSRFDNGMLIPNIFKKIYDSFGDNAKDFGDPFQISSPNSLFEWLISPVNEDIRIPNFLYEIYKTRSDIQAYCLTSFLRVEDILLKWAKVNLPREYGIMNDFLAIAKARCTENTNTKGINLIGHSRGEFGIGESCRRAARAIETVGIPFGIINYTNTTFGISDFSWQHKEITSPIYGANLLHFNAAELLWVSQTLGSDVFKGRYNIGYWLWELTDFPDEWCNAFNLVDEVWVPSNFIMRAISRKSPVPVVRIPYGIELKFQSEMSRKYFGLPENRFLFLAMYDILSIQQRKNPKGAIDAFKRAFQNNPSVGLVVKINNGNHNAAEVLELKEFIREIDNIYLIDTILNRDEVNSLIHSVDSIVSLHRSEGFGLVLAEAMYFGKPVIGTNWSGNTDFMDEENSCPVHYELVKIGADYGPYKANQVWAEPDIEHAVYFMKKIVADRTWRQRIASNGQATIKTKFSPTVVGEMTRQRLAKLGFI